MPASVAPTMVRKGLTMALNSVQIQYFREGFRSRIRHSSCRGRSDRCLLLCYPRRGGRRDSLC